MKIHEKLDAWLDEVLPEIFEDDRQPTLMEMSDLITRTRQQFMGEWLPILIREKYRDLLEQEYAPCPQCGKMHRQRFNSAKELRTMQGEGKISRPWFYCNDCELGYSPLDETLEISRKKTQLDVQKRATKLSAEVTFQRGEDLFQELTGQPISDHCLHETFEAVGAETRIEEVIPSREEIEERIKKATRSTWRPILVVASDGAHLPTRPKAPRKGKRGPGQWQEAKGFRIYLMGVDSIIHRKIHYRSDRKGGYPIGSGGIESAHKFISHTRLKPSGAWWKKENGNAMLRIRCALYNGTYDRVFDHYKQAHLNQKRVSKLKTG
jgi:hypothetical protein